MIEELILWLIMTILLGWLMWESGFLTVDLMGRREPFLDLTFGMIATIIGIATKTLIRRISYDYLPLTQVKLISPSGKEYSGFKAVEAERISRKHKGWTWQ